MFVYNNDTNSKSESNTIYIYIYMYSIMMIMMRYDIMTHYMLVLLLNICKTCMQSSKNWDNN